jgi:diadenylate cyclase
MDLLPVFLQILIFSALVYYVLKFLSGTRGAGILRGFLFLFAVFFLTLYVLSRLFSLHELDWFLDKIGPLSAFALVLVFQPELRRGMVRLGENRSFFEHKTPKALNAIEEVIESVKYLSRNRIGALVILSGDIGLGAYQDKGVRLDSVVKWELVVTIFWNKSPLHDGAVIIHNDRIVAARCWIPEISDTQIDGTLGTRHRAGIRITEDSDALALIVSEQTGRVSVAIKGELATDIDHDNLQTIVQAHYISKQGSASQRL